MFCGRILQKAHFFFQLWLEFANIATDVHDFLTDLLQPNMHLNPPSVFADRGG